MNDLFRGVGVEIELGTEDDFLKIKETLTRIGVASKKDKTIYQSCHILHKQGRYSILHFKELFALDGRVTDISDNDIQRRNSIAKLLHDWGLLKILDLKKIDGNYAPMCQIKVLSYKEKDDWELVSKYRVGNKSILRNETWENY